MRCSPAPRLIGSALVLAAVMVPAAARAAEWGTPQRIDGAVSLSQPVAAINARGDAVIAWSTAGGAVRATLRARTGRFGRAQTLANAGSGAQRGVSVAVATDGTAVVNWAVTARRSPRYRIRAAVCRRARCSAAQTIGSSTTAVRALPVVRFGPHGDAIVLWHRDDVAAQLAVLRRGAARFGPASTLLRMPLTELAWAPMPSGRLALVWTSSGPDGPYVAFSTARVGGNLTRPRAISPSGRSAAAIAVSTNGALIAAFVRGQAGEGGAARGPVEVTTTSPGRVEFGPARQVSAEGVDGGPLALVAGPHGSAALGLGASPNWPDGALGTGGWADVASRGATVPFAPAHSLVDAGIWASSPAVAIDASQIVVSAAAAAGDDIAVLRVATNPAGTTPVASTLASAPRTHSTHIYWFTPTVAAAGSRSIVAWSRGTKGPIEVFAR